MLVTIEGLAQHKNRRGRTTQAEAIANNYKDSLTLLRQQLDSVMQVNQSLCQKADGRYFRLFVPPTFYHSGARKWLSLSPQGDDEVADAVDEAMMNLYLRRPDLITNHESRLAQTGSLREDVNKEVKQQVDLTGKTDPVPEGPDIVPVTDIVITKPNFWKFNFDGSLQFMQNYVSGNWHKGGESTYSAVGLVTMELNYNDKDRITFENKLEMKLGFQTSPSDTVHKFKTNNDIIRLTSKLGLQASKKWYYSLQLLTYTQFARGYKANDEFVYSDFFSPFDLNIGIGMEYKVSSLQGRLTGTLNFLPLSFNFRYVGREALIARYGVRGNHHTLEDFGSQFTADLQWKITEQISWKTRLYTYTSYRRAVMEWENQFQLKVSKFFSANIFVYPRFDDSGGKDDKLGFFQFQEYMSLGLNYSF